jgi:hypothetical protein
VLTETGDGLVGQVTDVLAPVPDVEGLLLDGLAELEASRSKTLRDASLALGQHGSDSLVIAVLGALSEQDACDLAGRRQGTSTAIAVLLRTWTWGSAPTDSAAAREFANNVVLMRNLGWRVVPATAGNSLADLWPLAARGAVPTERPAAAAGTVA